MKFRLGVTDTNWFSYLSTRNPEDVNFWQPGGGTQYKTLNPGDLFVFKLKYPLNKIGGVGFFFRQTKLPISIAWETFGTRNGCDSFDEFQKKILSYRTNRSEANPEIGCIVLTNPVFFKREDWIETPSDWSKNIVTGKNYDIEDEIGKKIWNQIQERLMKYLILPIENGKSLFEVNEPFSPEYGLVLAKVRIGQGAFRASVTDAYQKRCSITGERTLPVLEAAHIKPYSESGPNLPTNGLLLRSDIHKLFDTGYMTITKELKIEVSRRIKAEFENGKEYYQYHGRGLALPKQAKEAPGSKFLDWHNQFIYNG